MEIVNCQGENTMKVRNYRNNDHIERLALRVKDAVTPPAKPTSAFCRMYKCEKRIFDNTGYCEEHCSPLRPGLPTYYVGSAPIVHKLPKK